MNNRFRVSSTLPRKLEELSISPDTVLRQASLPKGLFKLERILVTTEEFFALYRGIAEASDDPAIGLRLGTEERVERYDPIKLAALSARSFRSRPHKHENLDLLVAPVGHVNVLLLPVGRKADTPPRDVGENALPRRREMPDGALHAVALAIGFRRLN